MNTNYSLTRGSPSIFNTTEMETTVFASIEAPWNGTRYTQAGVQSALRYSITALDEYISLRQGLQATHVQQPRDTQPAYAGTSTGPVGLVGGAEVVVGGCVVVVVNLYMLSWRGNKPHNR